MPYRYLQSDYPLAFAHRGGNVAAPENTVAAFRHATDLGYQYLETDVHRTNDGVLVAFHDAELERVAGLTGVIADHSWSELQAVRLGDGHTIPTLDELLETFPEAHFNIDPKEDDTVGLLGDAIVQHGALHRVCIGSFSDQRIELLQARLGADLCTSPGPRGVAVVLAGAYGVGNGRQGTHGCLQIPPKWGPVQVTEGMVRRIHSAGLQVHIWTINTREEMHRLYDIGVDGVMTDKTDMLRDVLIERGEWPSAT